jgi:hypothetical protein
MRLSFLRVSSSILMSQHDVFVFWHAPMLVHWCVGTACILVKSHSCCVWSSSVHFLHSWCPLSFYHHIIWLPFPTWICKSHAVFYFNIIKSTSHALNQALVQMFKPHAILVLLETFRFCYMLSFCCLVYIFRINCYCSCISYLWPKHNMNEFLFLLLSYNTCCFLYLCSPFPFMRLVLALFVYEVFIPFTCVEVN